jgi:hypothetical protein
MEESRCEHNFFSPGQRTPRFLWKGRKLLVKLKLGAILSAVYLV